jgi:hypothetical protein
VSVKSAFLLPSCGFLAFQPFELSIEELVPLPEVVLRKFQPGEDWESTPLFAGIGRVDDYSSTLLCFHDVVEFVGDLDSLVPCK